MTPQQREEQVREESKLLNNLKKNLVAKKAVLEDDLRGKLELKKIKMLDSRNSFVDGILQDVFWNIKGCGLFFCYICGKQHHNLPFQD